MNIPRKGSSSFFDIGPIPVRGSELAAHFVTDLMVSGSYLLLIFIVVYLNRTKHVSIYVPRRTYLVAFGVVFLLTFSASLVSLLMPGVEVYLGYKIFVVVLILAMVLAVWRVLPRYVDPIALQRHGAENAAIAGAINARRTADAKVAAALASIDARVDERTAELTAANVSLEKEVIERRLAEERSGEAKRRLDELIMRTNTAHAVINSDGEVLECNQALAQILGRRTIEEIQGRKLSRLFGLKDDAGVSHFVNETLRQGSFASDIEVAPPARGQLYVEASGVASIENGRPCVMALFRDMTERKTAENDLLRGREAMTTALDVARKANATRSDFLAKMNHELRTPLNGIIGLAEIIRHKASGKSISVVEARKLAGNIHQSGRHLLSVVDDLLDLSRLDSGSRDFQPTKVAVRAEVDSALMTLATIALKKRMIIVNRVPEDLEWTIDQRAFKQIVINLVNNAVKFSPPGTKIEVEVTRTAQAMSLHVRDHGPGLTEDDKVRILTPFSRGEYAENNKIDGVGLGLTIVSELLKLQGGRIDIQSELGKGATFTAVFPAGADIDVAAAAI